MNEPQKIGETAVSHTVQNCSRGNPGFHVTQKSQEESCPSLARTDFSHA